MNLRNLLKHRNGLYGVLALWIIFFHINRRLGEPIQIPILRQLIESGNIGVDIFMFFSGCCLYLSMKKKPDVKSFYRKRFIRLIPSYLIISIPFWFWRSLVEAPMKGGGFHFIRFFADLSSATFWLTGIETTWFVFAILAFYLLFPAIFKAVNKGWKVSLLMLLMVYIVNVIGINFIPIYDKSSIAWTRLPVFMIGVIAGRYIDSFDLGRFQRSAQIGILSGTAAAVILFLFIFPLNLIFDGERIPSEYMWLSYGPITVCIVTLLAAILGPLDRRANVIGKALETIGGISLEMYMSHIIILHWFTYYGWLENVGLWSIIIITGAALAVSCIVQRLNEIILYRIEKRL